MLFAKKQLNSEFLCFFSDLIFEENIVDKLLNIKSDFVLVVDTSKVLRNTMRIIKKKNEIVEIGNQISKKKGHGNFIGIAKFSKKGAILLKRYLIKQKENKKDYYTIVLNKMIANGLSINYYDCKNQFWKEIDTYKDFCDMKKILNSRAFNY